MVKIRLKRLGRKHRPFYRIVVTDIRNRRDGAPLEELGFYDPVAKKLKLNRETALAWVAKGAQPTETVQRLINKASDTNDVIQLEVAQKQRLSRKARAAEEARKAEEAAAKAKAQEEAAAAAAAAATPAEEPAAEEAPAEETPAEA